MATKYLIFPMVLSDQDFLMVREWCAKLKSMDFNRLTMLVNCKQSIVYHLAQACIDLEEVLSNHNARGYRYNSYVLNMACLKLTLVVEILKAKDPKLFDREISTIQLCIDILKSMLVGAYEIFEMN